MSLHQRPCFLWPGRCHFLVYAFQMARGGGRGFGLRLLLVGCRRSRCSVPLLSLHALFPVSFYKSSSEAEAATLSRLWLAQASIHVKPAHKRCSYCSCSCINMSCTYVEWETSQTLRLETADFNIETKDQAQKNVTAPHRPHTSFPSLW